MSKNLQPVLQELHKLFNSYNETFFENKLPDVIITIRSRGKRKGVLGWFSVGKVWTNGTEEKHEINLVAEAINRPFLDIATTMLHEMIHLYCHVNEIQDTSRAGHYHNKNFKTASEQHGLVYEHGKPDPKIGYSSVVLKPETIAIVETFGIRSGVFNLARKQYTPGTGDDTKKTNIIKWVCPSCGDIIRSSKPDIKAYCMNDIDAEGNEKEPCGCYFEKA